MDWSSLRDFLELAEQGSISRAAVQLNVSQPALSRLLAVHVAERLPGVPRGIHDPRLFVDARALVAECARHGVRLRVRGVRPQLRGTLRWLVRSRSTADGAPAPEIVPTFSAAVLYQGRGVKRA